MVADLAYVDGQAQMFYNEVGGTPWHRDGFPFGVDFTFDQAIEMVDFPLEKRPYGIPDWDSINDDGQPQIYNPSRNAYYVYRPDTKDILGTVGKDYEVVTNKDAFEVLRPLVDAGHLKLETGGVLRRGADAWLLGRWDMEKFGPSVQEVFSQDGGILPYATVMANHNGRRGIMVGETAIRIVCSNTLSAAESDAENKMKRWRVIQHFKGAKTRLVTAADELFNSVVQRFELISKQYKTLMECELTQQDFGKLVLDVVAKDPRKSKKFNPEAKLAEVVLERALTKRREVQRLWTAGKGHSGQPNAWFAYNGCVEALDHNRDLWPNKDGSWRSAALLTGKLAEMKNTVLDNLVRHATLSV